MQTKQNTTRVTTNLIHGDQKKQELHIIKTKKIGEQNRGENKHITLSTYSINTSVKFIPEQFLNLLLDYLHKTES